MADEPDAGAPASEPAGWNTARPEVVPEPTLWPPTLALAVTLCLWGLASSLIITGVGICLFAVALAGWIKNIRDERKGTIR